MSILEEFMQVVARTEDIPADLEKLVLHTVPSGTGPFDGLGLLALLPGQEDAINDISYLSEDELKDPDIQSNIAAIREVSALARFVAQDCERNLFGYWLGQPARRLHEAPIVKFDTEGQFSLLPGGSLVEAVCGDQGDETAFEASRAQFAALGITFQAPTLDDWYALSDQLQGGHEKPDALHKTFYNRHRQQRGLKPVE